MFNLTKQERQVLAALVFIFLIGGLLHYGLKKIPPLGDFINVLESDRIYPKVDLNRASYEEIEAVPAIGPTTANRIVNYRNQHGVFQDVSELKTIEGIAETTYRKAVKYLKVSSKNK